MQSEITENSIIHPDRIHGAIMTGAFLGMLLFFLTYHLRKSEKMHPAYDDKNMKQRLDAFQPKELVSEDCDQVELLKIDTSTVDESDSAVDLVRVNYLNMLNSQLVRDGAIDCIRRYGVGTCGPRAFLGTTEVHLELEKRLAEFLDTDDAIVYSYGFAAASNALDAYCKRNDVIFCDEKVNSALEQGMLATNATVIPFKHNDVEDLRQKLNRTIESQNLFRRFLIIEGIYATTGSICPLPGLLALSKEFKLRVFLDESTSFGVLGTTGRGVTENYHIDIKEIDLIIGSLEGALGSIGSFCAGSTTIIENQRLSSKSDIFSASLVTFHAQAAIVALTMIKNSPEELHELQLLSRKVHKFLITSMFYDVLSSPLSPCKVFSFKRKEQRRQWERQICTYCKENGVYIKTADNGLVMNLNVALYFQEEKLQKVLQVLECAAESINVE